MTDYLIIAGLAVAVWFGLRFLKFAFKVIAFVVIFIAVLFFYTKYNPRFRRAHPQITSFVHRFHF